MRTAIVRPGRHVGMRLSIMRRADVILPPQARNLYMAMSLDPQHSLMGSGSTPAEASRALSQAKYQRRWLELSVKKRVWDVVAAQRVNANPPIAGRTFSTKVPE